MHNIIITHCSNCHVHPIIEYPSGLCPRCWVAEHDAQKPQPEDAIAGCEAYLARCEQQLTTAVTLNEHLEARLWIDNATRNLSKWKAFSARQVAR